METHKKYFAKKIISSILLYSLGFFGSYLACSQTEGGGSGGLDPSGAPYLIEGVLCSDITPQQKPVAIADNYPIGDRIYVWLHWGNMEGTHDVEVFWYDPDGDKVHQDLFEISTRDNRFISWFYLDTTANAKLGEWLVAIFLDQDFVRSYVFDLF